MDLLDTDPGDVDRLDDAEGLRLTGAWPAEADWDGLTLDACLLDRPTSQSLSLVRSRVLGSRVVDPDVVTLAATGSTWRDSEVSGGRVAALELAGARLTSVVLRDVRLGYVNLRDATLDRVTLTGCTVDTLDLTGASVARLTVTATSARELELVRARCSDVDLRGLDVRRLTGVDALRGCVVTRGQLHDLAPLLAEALGLRVE